MEELTMNDTEKKTTTEGAERPAGAAEAVTHGPAQEAAEKPADQTEASLL